MATIVILVVLAALVLWGVSVYNRIIQLENRYENAWSQIDVQLKRRADLVPNLVETVKGYATHERQLFEEIARSREAMINAKGVSESAEAANMMSAALGRLFALAEAYPELKANQNFMMLQEELAGIENKIAYARQFYNDAVLQYNNAIEQVPGNLLAGPMNKKEAVFLEIPEENKAVPSVSFGTPAAG